MPAQLEDVANRVKTGESLSAAFEAQESIPQIYTTTLLAGERSGNLQEVLERYVAFQRVSLTFRKKLTASLIYPGLLLTLVSGLMVFHVHRRDSAVFKAVRGDGIAIAGMTLALLAFGTWTQRNFLWIALSVLIAGALAYRFSITEKGRDASMDFESDCPCSAKSGSNIRSRCSRALCPRLLTGGLPLVPSLDTAARSISSRRVSKAVTDSIVTVREGKSLADALTATKVFPDLATEMIAVGEQTGALPQMLNSVAEFFEEDVATALTAALALIEPAILIVMGVVVVFILISLYLPIFSLGSAAGGQG